MGISFSEMFCFEKCMNKSYNNDDVKISGSSIYIFPGSSINEPVQTNSENESNDDGKKNYTSISNAYFYD